MRGFWAILLKEFAHIRRERSTLFFAFVLPVLQLTIFGYAIDTTIEDIRTVVLDLDGRAQAREVASAFENTKTFRIVERVTSHADLERAIVSGRAKVGVVLPPDLSERLMQREQATVQVIIDGSDSQVATTALNAAQLIGLNRSLSIARVTAETLQISPSRDPFGHFALPLEVRPRLLFNPDLRTEVFFVPALVGIILQNVTIFLTAFSIVRERELGTLEQLFVTPVGRVGLLLGKLAPYAVLGFTEMLIVLMAMRFLFGVAIQGDLLLLLGLSLLFLITALGLGLLISTVSRSQLEAMQKAFFVLLPSVLLSGFMFPRESMPLPIYLVSFAIPVTYFLEMLRGVILRSATLADLWPHVAGLSVCCVVILTLSAARFRKQLD
jgi:ABC transporter DrrB family efflux protein